MKCLIALILFLGALTGCAKNDLAGDWNLRVGEKIELPAIPLVPSEREFAKSGIRYVLFFATYCPPCKEQLSYLTELSNKNFVSGMQNKILLISSGEDSATVMDYINSSGIPYPVLIDESAEFSEKVGGSFIPRGLVINSNNEIIEIVEGFDKEKVDSILTRIQ